MEAAKHLAMEHFNNQLKHDDDDDDDDNDDTVSS